MTRAHYLFALGVALLVLSLFVNVPWSRWPYSSQAWR
jgi:hypothetical protein